jgi:hypothetical protein
LGIQKKLMGIYESIKEERFEEDGRFDEVVA